MTRIFVELPSFRTEWKAMGLTEEDLSRLQKELLSNPTVGKDNLSISERNELKKLVHLLENEQAKEVKL